MTPTKIAEAMREPPTELACTATTTSCPAAEATVETRPADSAADLGGAAGDIADAETLKPARSPTFLRDGALN